jgi:hypothetical protein
MAGPVLWAIGTTYLCCVSCQDSAAGELQRLPLDTSGSEGCSDRCAASCIVVWYISRSSCFLHLQAKAASCAADLIVSWARGNLPIATTHRRPVKREALCEGRSSFSTELDTSGSGGCSDCSAVFCIIVLLLSRSLCLLHPQESCFVGL